MNVQLKNVLLLLHLNGSLPSQYFGFLTDILGFRFFGSFFIGLFYTPLFNFFILVGVAAMLTAILSKVLWRLTTRYATGLLNAKLKWHWIYLGLFTGISFVFYFLSTFHSILSLGPVVKVGPVFDMNLMHLVLPAISVSLFATGIVLFMHSNLFKISHTHSIGEAQNSSGPMINVSYGVISASIPFQIMLARWLKYLVILLVLSSFVFSYLIGFYPLFNSNIFFPFGFAWTSYYVWFVSIFTTYVGIMVIIVETVASIWHEHVEEKGVDSYPIEEYELREKSWHYIVYEKEMK